jgi:hypothetical protein
MGRRSSVLTLDIASYMILLLAWKRGTFRENKHIDEGFSPAEPQTDAAVNVPACVGGDPAGSKAYDAYHG